MLSVQREIDAVSGYLDLGMIDEALATLEALENAHNGVRRAQFLALRLKLSRKFQRWDSMRKAATRLKELAPHEPEVWISEADAIRHAVNVKAAADHLREAEILFPDNAHIKFQLGCYHCQLKRLEEGEQYVREAAAMQAHWQRIALQDHDVKALWPKLRGDDTWLS
ncbi:MAG: hypothetical protein AAGK14_08295 [Verrucomicrobiota bacterium]